MVFEDEGLNEFYSQEYYEPLSRVIEDNFKKITLTWNVNAWTKVKKSLRKTVKSKCFSFDRDEDYKQLLTNGNILCWLS